MKRIQKSFSIFLIAILLFGLCSCQGAPISKNEEQKDISYGEDFLLDTYCYIKIFEPGKEELISSAFELATSFEGELSRTIEGSAVDRLNKAPKVTGLNCDDSYICNLGVVLETALEFSKASGGVFNPCIGAVSKLWNFSGDGKLPSDEKIKEALNYVGEDFIRINDDGTIVKELDNVEIDLGAIAKGYIAKQVANHLRDNGVHSAILSFGGNIVMIGAKEDGSKWNIGVEAPDPKAKGTDFNNRKVAESIYIDPADYDEEAVSFGMTPSASVVTSGTYERYIEDGGKLYHHILDPRTGYPVDTDLVSCTIAGADSMYCDALSTICILKGKVEAQKFMEQYPTYDYLFITEDGEIIKS